MSYGRISGLKHVPSPHAAVGDRAVGGGDLVEGYDGVHPGRQVAVRNGVEALFEPRTVGLGHHHAEGHAPPLRRGTRVPRGPGGGGGREARPAAARRPWCCEG